MLSDGNAYQRQHKERHVTKWTHSDPNKPRHHQRDHKSHQLFRKPRDVRRKSGRKLYQMDLLSTPSDKLFFSPSCRRRRPVNGGLKNRVFSQTANHREGRVGRSPRTPNQRARRVLPIPTTANQRPPSGSSPPLVSRSKNVFFR